MPNDFSTLLGVGRAQRDRIATFSPQTLKREEVAWQHLLDDNHLGYPLLPLMLDSISIHSGLNDFIIVSSVSIVSPLKNQISAPEDTIIGRLHVFSTSENIVLFYVGNECCFIRFRVLEKRLRRDALIFIAISFP